MFQDSGFLDEDGSTSVSHISSCSNLSSLVSDTPIGKSARWDLSNLLLHIYTSLAKSRRTVCTLWLYHIR